MSQIVSFIVGIIVGVIGAWWFFERRDAQSREEIEAGWKKKLDHIEAEVKRADSAHDETKERLRLLQQDQAVLAAEKTRLEEAVAEAGERLAAEKAVAESLAEEKAEAERKLAELAEKLEALEAKAAEQPVPAIAEGGADAGLDGGDEADRAAQARRRIDAKLAQLPAGSSARQRLLAERAALDAGEPEKPADGAEPELEPEPEPEPEEAPLFEAPDAPADDLERIRGIGPVLKERLNRLGVTTFAQIAAFTEADLARVDEVLDFRGRIQREGWVEQARALAETGGAPDRL